MGQNQMMRNSSLLFILVFLLFSCEAKHYYQDTKDVKDEWKSNQPQIFTFDVKDPKPSAVNIGFVLRNNTSYEYSNLYLFTKFIDPKGNEMIDTLQYYIANPDGSWIGKGMTTKEMMLVYRENLPIKDSGRYQLKIWQGMRTKNLKGIEDISLIVDKAE
ncbi:gliding motility lipoprotein GldH [Empedobacter sp. UBA4754]|uniref:gliding motility lipoprotein GldH n=2 Tax=unclassified Empedobacter TaxID=2643773 RepID=UPI0025BD06A4|nr:gliding motility lipoprotein GldH [Empedobacter sp. UBA4754]